jgi:hypothetical protein
VRTTPVVPSWVLAVGGSPYSSIEDVPLPADSLQVGSGFGC